MKGSSRNRSGIDVYDFDAADALAEVTAREALDKYKLLECIAHASSLPRKDSGYLPCVDLDDPDENTCEKTSMITDSLGMGGGSPIKESNTDMTFAPQFASSGDGHNNPVNSCSELHMQKSSPHGSSLGESISESSLSESPSNGKSVDLNSDAENANEQASTSDFEEDGSFNGHASNCHMEFMELVDSNRELVVTPEYIIYRETHYPETLISFSQTCVKIEASATCGKGRSLNLERSIDDIVSISCQWIKRVEMVLIKLQVISKDAVQTDGNHISSCVEELKAYVVDPSWFRKQEAITALNVKYYNIWDFVVIADVGLNEVDMSSWKRYFPSFDEPFEELVYPKGDSDAVSISKRDVDLLQPETFVNDTIIDFYIKYLKSEISQKDIHRFHFFNSFFFRKLADLDKDPSSASDGRAAFIRVRKWTRKINLFEKDYIFIPVNFNLHWSLIVICHPGEVASFVDEHVAEAAKVPCILHMDSIKGSHTGLKNLVQSYLWEEWKEKGNDTSEQTSTKFSNLRFVSLDLPQQENSFDCGLFLLHYLELFLVEAPPSFNPFKISKFSRYLNMDWFQPAEASHKRTLIQKLIHELLDYQLQAASPDDSCDEPLSPEILETKVENSYRGNTLARTSNPTISHHSDPENRKGIEIDLLGDPSVQNLQASGDDSGLVLRELFEPGSCGEALRGHCQSFNDQSFYRLDNRASSMEAEDARISAQFDYMPYEALGGTDFREMDGNSPEAVRVPSSADCCFRGPNYHAWKSDISLKGENDNRVECVDPSACVAEGSQEIGVHENGNDGDEEVISPCGKYRSDEHPLQEEDPEEPELAAPPADPSETVIIVGSQDSEADGLDRKDTEPEDLSLPQYKLSMSSARGSKRDLDLGESLVRDEAVEAPIASAEISEHKKAAEQTEEEHDAKRRRISPPLEDSGGGRRNQ